MIHGNREENMKVDNLHGKVVDVTKAILNRNPGRLIYPSSLSDKEIRVVRRLLRQKSQSGLEKRIQFEAGEHETTIFIGRR